MSEREGVVKYRFEQRPADLPGELAPLAAALAAWRRVWRVLGWLGQDPARYGGFGFGNLSARLAEGFPSPAGCRPFLVTGSQTGHLPHLGLADFARVDRWDLAGHRLQATGRTPPSSEALTHAALYELDPAIRAVFHLHAPVLWQRASLPRTSPSIAYGTPEMGREVARLWAALDHPATGLVAMGGHRDGVVTWGTSVHGAGGTVLAALRRTG